MIYIQNNLVDVPQFTNLEPDIFELSGFNWQWVSFNFDKANESISVMVSIWQSEPSKNFTKCFVFHSISILTDEQIDELLLSTDTFNGSIAQ